ncbi:MAG: RNA methyltransferase [bacterium]
MLSNRLLKYYSSLLYKKYRTQENKFIVEGKKLVQEGLNSNFTVEIVIVTEEFYKQNKDFMEFVKQSSIIERIPTDEVNKLSDTNTPQGIFAVFDQKPIDLNFRADDIVIGMDNISDPGNVGTILRNCDWFGVNNVYLSLGCAEIYNPKTIRSSMGSIFHLDFEEEIRFVEHIKFLKENGYTCYTTDLVGENIYNTKLPKKSFIIFSNEANGPSKELLKIVDKKLTIPKYGNAESLNVASASAIVLSEIVKKRG